MTPVIFALGIGILLGGTLAYWYEDVLRGPIMRAYDADLAGVPESTDSPCRYCGRRPSGEVLFLSDEAEESYQGAHGKIG